MTMKAALKARVFARLDARLNHEGPEPVALALSGGGDSRALLALVAEWGRAKNRPIVALTVDHRLNPESINWTRKAGEAARSEGVAWRELVWTEAKAGTAVQERARLARHALLADAARALGAKVILLGHTLDDVAENQWMQQDGTTLGALREWSASPVWPEGRGLMLMRPLLSERREVLRDFLASEAKDWIDDPANEDSRYARVRARQALSGNVQEAKPSELEMFRWQAGPLSQWGVLEFSRKDLIAASGRVLATALLCASGQSRPPRGDRLQGLKARLETGEDFAAVLSGARLEARGDEVIVAREAGEMQRSNLQPLTLKARESAIWDGRFEIMTLEEGLSVHPAKGMMSRLDDKDREALSALPASIRPTMPVIIAQGSDRPSLAFNKAKLSALAVPRFVLNCPVSMGETTQEAGLFASTHGITRSTTLFSV